MITVETTSTNLTRKKYVLDVILMEFGRTEYNLVINEDLRESIIICNKVINLCIKSIFLESSEKTTIENVRENLELIKVKDLRLLRRLTSDTIFTLYYNSEEPIISISDKIHLNFDLLGLVFFYLSRYEEFFSNDLDSHGRYPYSSSINKKFDINQKPVVDELVSVFLSLLKIQIPSSNRKITVHFDLDYPIVRNDKIDYRCIGNFFREFFSYRTPLASIKNLFNALSIKNLAHFNYVINILKNNGIDPTFFLIVNQSNKDFDTDYCFRDSSIKSLLSLLLQSNIKLGLHTSYDTLSSSSLLNTQLDNFSSIKRFNQSVNVTLRAHYLKFSVNDSVDIYEELNISHDCSYYYPDEPGFRCGTSAEYSAYSFNKEKKCKLKISPFIIMDTTFLDQKYLGYGSESPQMYDTTYKLVRRSLKYGNSPVVLFHDNYLLDPAMREYFEFTCSL